MRSFVLLACFLATLPVSAAKKPVTIDIATATPPPSPGTPVWAPDGNKFAFLEDKKIHLYDIASKTERLLFALSDLSGPETKAQSAEPFDWENRRVREQTIQWSPDGTHLLVSTEGALYWWGLSDGKSHALTTTRDSVSDAKLSPDGRRVSFRSGHDLNVLEIDSGKKTRLTHDGSPTLLNAELDWVYPEELELETAHWWSPDSKHIAYLQFDISKQQIYPHTDLLRRDVVYEPQRYPKAGSPNADVRVGVISASGGKTKWLASVKGTEALLARVHWLPDSGSLALQRLNRLQTELELASVGIANGQSRTILKETDPKWVNLGDDPKFLDQGARFLWTSERDGFRHIYLASQNGEAMQLTSGKWEVTEISGVDEQRRVVYYTSTEQSPLERQLYAIGFDGKNKRRVTRAPGTHAVSFDPHGHYYVDTHSSLKEPVGRTICKSDGSELAVFRARNAKIQDEYEILPTEIVQIKAPDGDMLYASVIRPANFDPERKYPAVVNVYGGPHAQTVRDAWAGANWNQVLAHRGFVVWQLDNRGSAGRGHAWEARLYRRFGRQELEDQKLGIEHLVSMGFVDAKRIAMNGWSYGGYMTLYTLLNAPDLLKAGIAGAPVTDFRNYDTIYTERYMGLPSENESGYHDSAPLHYAANLKSRLMLLHNFEDDNVLFQHTMQMANELQKAGKQFDLQLYPQKAHGVTGTYRKHLMELMTAFMERELKP